MVICKYYQSGFCKFGDRCRFEHIDRANYPSGHSTPRYPEQYVNRFPGPNYINSPGSGNVGVGVAGGAYNQPRSMLTNKKPDQYHYVAPSYDRQYLAGPGGGGGAGGGNQGAGGQSFNQSRPGQHGQPHHHHHHHQQQQQQQQQGIIPMQYWQVQRQQQLQQQQQQLQQQQQQQQQQQHHQAQRQQQQQQQQQQQHHHHHHHHPGPGQGQVQHQQGQSHVQQQSAGGFSFNQKLKEIEQSQKPQVGFSFNRALQQIQHQYQPHLAQQAQNQYYLTPTAMLTVPVQTPYYGVTMPMSMNPLAPMFSPMLPSNSTDPTKMISSYLPQHQQQHHHHHPQQQQQQSAKISMNLSDDDSGIYSIMSSLNQDELNQFKAEKFSFQHIPLNPPPKELCL